MATPTPDIWSIASAINASKNPAVMAALYALDTQESTGEAQTIESLEKHLDVLFEAGADFDTDEAHAAYTAALSCS